MAESTRRAGIALAAALALAGCGGGRHVPLLAHDDARGLISLAHRIAGEGACAQARDIPRLRRRAIVLVNAHRVPPALQDTLLSGVNALGALTPVCLPAVPRQPVTTTSPAPPPAPPPARHKPPKPHGHGHDKGKKH